jgi:hypothetical protein
MGAIYFHRAHSPARKQHRSHSCAEFIPLLGLTQSPLLALPIALGSPLPPLIRVGLFHTGVEKAFYGGDHCWVGDPTLMQLLTLLETVPDFRHLRGLRHDLWFVLLLMITGTMCGYWGSRPLATFAQEYGGELCQQLGVPVPVRMPSYSTFRRILVTLNFTVFANVFNQWAQHTFGVDSGEWVAIDGKSIKGSLSHYETAQQNFVMMVSVFSHQRGFVLHSQPMDNKNISEQHLVQQLLETLDLKGAVVTADALHCQKNSPALAPATSALSAVREGQSPHLVCLAGGHESKPRTASL